MTIDVNSVAAAVGSGAENVQFKVEATNVDRKVLVIGTGTAAAKAAASYTANIPTRVYSSEDAASKAGFGSEVDLVAAGVCDGNLGSTEVYVAIQDEAGAGVAATGLFVFTNAPTEDGYCNAYIAGKRYRFAVADGATPTAIGDDLVAEMALDPSCPLTGVNTAGSVAMTAVAKGTFYNDVEMSVNWGVNEETPAGLIITITPMASGANDPTLSDVTTAIGTGDLANAEFFTDWVVCYGRLGTTEMDILSVYNGTGNLNEGCWMDTVHRPFRCLHGDTDDDTAALTALVAITDVRLLDRTNGVIAVPGSPDHPQVIAGTAIGIMARLNQNRPEENYVGQVLPGVIAGAKADQWTKDYSARNSAVKDGISPTRVVDGVVAMQNVLTFYRPASVPIASNGYRSMRNISILQNVVDNVYNNYERAKWQGFSIVADVANVSNATARKKARDLGDVRGDMFALADEFEKKAWIYSAAFTKEKISAGGFITIRAGGLGFDTTLPILLSGEGGIINNTTQFDTSLSIVTG